MDMDKDTANGKVMDNDVAKQDIVSPLVDADTFRKIHPQEYLNRFTSQGVRPDGRVFETFRPTLINKGSISTANGSALVRMGNTMVVCGIKVEIAEPSINTPEEGFIIPNVELSPMCSPRFKPGPPAKEAQVASERLNLILTRVKPINYRTLCIEKGKAVWCIYADVFAINYDGNIIDASLLAMMTALKTCDIPIAQWNEDAQRVECLRETKKLELQKEVYASTFAVFGDHVLCDPTDSESVLCDEQLTISMNNDLRLCHIIKSGGLTLTPKRLKYCINIARKRCRDLAILIAES